MLNKVSLGIRDLQKYRLVLGNELIDEIEKLADELKSVRICHVNSTSFGGGVAELLSSFIPLARSVGLTVDWQVIHGDRRFFTVTKSLHNALQGSDGSLIQREETDRLYKTQNQMNAREMDCDYDVFIINDPQPAALRHFSEDTHARWVWRCHLALSYRYIRAGFRGLALSAAIYRAV
jgi:trehalose synthase